MALVPHGGGGGSYSLSVPPLTTTNYISWAIKVEALLDAQGLWCAVAPADGTAVDAGKSKTARALLLGALSEEVLLPVSMKPTAKEVWDSLKVRFVGADRVRAARLASLRSEFDRMRMDGGEDLDSFAGKLGSMAARFAGLGTTLGDAALVKKLLDTVPDHLYPVVAGIEQFCDVDTMAFEDALGRLKAFDERTRRRRQDGGGHGGDQLLLTAAQWRTRERQLGGARDDDDGNRTASSGGGGRRGRCYKCGQRGHFRRECPQLQKGPAAEQALLADANVDYDGLL